jgi:hypothetical protein
LQFGDGYFVTAGMIPYPEPFQSMFQKRRLGTLGFEWRPPSVDFAVGPTYNATTGEYQTIPIIDPDRWEPLPEITDFVELEPENEVISDDTDSEYDGMDEYSSEGEKEILSGDSSGASYSSAEIDIDNPSSAAHKRNSRRKKKSEVSGKHLIFMLPSFFHLFSFYYMFYRLILLLHLVGELRKEIWMNMMLLQFQDHIGFKYLGMVVLVKGKGPLNLEDCDHKDVLLVMHAVFCQRWVLQQKRMKMTPKAVYQTAN